MCLISTRGIEKTWNQKEQTKIPPILIKAMDIAADLPWILPKLTAKRAATNAEWISSMKSVVGPRKGYKDSHHSGIFHRATWIVLAGTRCIQMSHNLRLLVFVAFCFAQCSASYLTCWPFAYVCMSFGLHFFFRVSLINKV